jgi:hypothetical protein
VTDLPANLLDWPLDQFFDTLDVMPSVRLQNTLTMANFGNFKTLREVIACDANQLKRIPQFGNKSLGELRAMLTDYGLALRGEQRPPSDHMALRVTGVADRLDQLHAHVAQLEERLTALERMAGRPLAEFPQAKRMTQ